MANDIPVSTDVQVSITSTPTAPSRKGFGTMLCTTAETSTAFDAITQIKAYSSMDDVAADWNSSDEAYKAALSFFSQSPVPQTLKIAVWAASALIPAIMKCGGNEETVIATWQAVTTGSFKITTSAGATDITGLDFSGDADLDDVAATIDAALATATVPVSCTYSGTQFVFTADDGTLTYIDYLTAAASGTSIVTMLAGTQDLGASKGSKIAVETVSDFLDRVSAKDSDWYALGFTKEVRDGSLSTGDCLAAAAWTEARVKQYFTVTNNDATPDTAYDADSLTDIASKLKSLGYTRTFVVYSSTASQYPDFSAFGRASTVNFDLPDSTLTLKFKQLPGISTESITTAQLNNLTSKGVNVYVSKNGSPMLSEAMMAKGQGTYQDNIHGIDWLQNAIETNVFGRLYQATTKVPNTDAGTALLAQQVENALKQAVRNGLVAPGYDLDGNYYKTGYQIVPGLVKDVSASNRAKRQGAPITFTAIGAGAIHGIVISGTFITA